MNAGELAQLITSIATLIGVVSGVFVSIRNSRKIEEVHKATNSIVGQLVTTTAKASQAEGHALGLAEGLKETTKDPKI